MTLRVNNLVCTELKSLISQSFYVSKVEKVLWNLILNKDALDVEQQKRLFHELLPIITVGVYLEEQAHGSIQVNITGRDKRYDGIIKFPDGQDQRVEATRCINSLTKQVFSLILPCPIHFFISNSRKRMLYFYDLFFPKTNRNFPFLFCS